MKARVLVTGAAGFVGRVLVRELLARSYAVAGVVRAPAQAPELERAGARALVADLVDEAAAASAVTAFRAESAELPWLVHAAAKISYKTADAKLQSAANLCATQNVFRAAQRAGFARAVHTSSVVAVGVGRCASDCLNEDSPYNGATLRSAYMHTKRAAEEWVLEFARGTAFDVRVVNPSAIFGAGSLASNTTRFVSDVLRRGAPLLVPPGSLSVVGVNDVARGIVLALERGRSGRRYILTESCWTLREAFTLLARSLNASPPRGTLPLPVWRVVVALSRAADRVRPLELLAPQALEFLGYHLRFDGGRARAELGFAPQPFAAVLRETVQFARANAGSAA